MCDASYDNSLGITILASEFPQMGMYVVLTVKLRQKGSAESKPLDGETEQDEDPAQHRFDPDAPWPVRRGGVWLEVYSSHHRSHRSELIDCGRRDYAVGTAALLPSIPPVVDGTQTLAFVDGTAEQYINALLRFQVSNVLAFPYDVHESGDYTLADGTVSMSRATADGGVVEAVGCQTPALSSPRC